MISKVVFSSFFLVLSFSIYAAEPVLKLEGATLRGDEELPAVQYILPWQDPRKVDLTLPKQLALPDVALKPLSRYQYQFWLRQASQNDQAPLSTTGLTTEADTTTMEP